LSVQLPSDQVFSLDRIGCSAWLGIDVQNASVRADPKAFGALMRAIGGYTGHRTITLALQILALTFPRPGELRLAEWEEVDLDNSVWSIPAHRAKMRREHRIPLSRQALARFQELKAITGRGVLCFPSLRSLNKSLSENSLNAALRAIGYDGETHVAHGFRSSASSMLNEYSDFSADIIERALAHGDPDKIRRTYNRAQYWDERVRLSQWWADYLDALRTPGAVVAPQASASA
jgi:integrase